ncbi:MAG: NIPSNAP family protein [Pirellulaceae bacterium]
MCFVQYRFPFLFVLALLAGWQNAVPVLAQNSRPQEFYELRYYHINSAANQEVVGRYLEKALLPALGRMEIDRVGVFRKMDQPDDHALIVLIPFPNMETFAALNDRLEADNEYQTASAELMQLPKDKPPYQRIESRFMKAFKGMPVMELPEQTKNRSERMFEIRIYEAHNELKGRAKVAMFNDGEIDIMRDVHMAPVFYGETLIGPDVPNLIYMLSAANRAAHDEHWKAFGGHPEWNRMKGMEKYKDTVSKITNWYVVPEAYSQL